MFAFLDGDDIGSTLEILLLQGELHKTTAFSENINNALAEIKIFLKSQPNVKTHILGGDDILIEYDQTVVENSVIDELRSIFVKITGNRMSCGIGNDVNQAIWNLHKAKLLGKDRVYGGE